MSASKKIVVMGGTGLIGSKVVTLLRAAGHEAVAASPSTGVNALSGEGLADVLRATDAVVDVTNAPSLEPQAVQTFFRTTTQNLLAAEAAAGVRHHVLLSIVGVDRMSDQAYFAAKRGQEEQIELSGAPYTIVRATQFLEFLGGLADGNTVDGVVRLAACKFQSGRRSPTSLVATCGLSATRGRSRPTRPRATSAARPRTSHWSRRARPVSEPSI